MKNFLRSSTSAIALTLASFASDATVLPPPAAFGSSGAPITQSGSFNVNAQTLKHWIAAVARVHAKTGRGRVVILGDSTTQGTAASVLYTQSWPQIMAGQLVTAGIPTNLGSLWGSQNLSSGYSTYDPRVTVSMSTLWTVGGYSVGGTFWQFQNAGASTFAFAPTASFDTINFWYLQQPSQGTATINVDGGASLGTITFTNASQQVTTNNYSVTAGTHTVNIVPANNGQFYFLAIATYLSTSPAIDIYQGAATGAKANDFSQTGSIFLPMPVLQQIAPYLTIINLKVNDSNTPTNLATYTTQMQTIITAAKVSGDCMLMGGPPSNTTQATNGTLASYMAVLQTLAITNGCSLVSTPQRWTSFAAINPVMPMNDSLHPTLAGYTDIASSVTSALTLQPN